MTTNFFDWMIVPIPYDWAALLIRLAIGLSLLPYALEKIRKCNDPRVYEHFFPILAHSSRLSFYAAMAVETLASIFTILGFCTRLAAFAGACNMGIATWKVHDKKYYTANAMPYFFGFIALMFIGGGNFSLDYVLGK